MSGGANAFFHHAARALFSSALKHLHHRPDRSMLGFMRLLLTADRTTKHMMLLGSEAASPGGPSAAPGEHSLCRRGLYLLRWGFEAAGRGRDRGT